MVDLTNAPEGSLWLNRSGDLMRKGPVDTPYLPGSPIRMIFVERSNSRETPSYAGKFVKVFEHNGLSYYGTDCWDIVDQAYTECPY